MTTIRNAVKLTNAGAAIDKLKQERDTYRDLCVDLFQALILHQDLTRPIDNSSIAITKAESILGDSNAT